MAAEVMPLRVIRDFVVETLCTNREGRERAKGCVIMDYGAF